MEDSFKPRSLSISELFGDTKNLYKIPKYQRPYKWESEQVEQLWDDILESYENEVPNYFLGSVITANSYDEPQSPYIDVVDGQQRLTTLMILFCVIRDHFPNLNLNDYSNPLSVNIDIIRSAIIFNGRASRLRLHTHSSHQSDFEVYILNEGATKILQSPYKYQVKNDQEPKFKFINTALIFKEKLNSLPQSKLEMLINYLFYQVKIIRIDCTSRDFAIKLFQVLNNRGLDLTAADLIKSFLLEKLYKKYENDLSTSKLKEENFMSDWREMEQIIKQCDDMSLNDLFIIYAHYLLGSNQKRSFTEELQDLFENQDPNQVIASLKQFINNYYEKIYCSRDKNIYSFRYLRWSNYWKAILMTAITTNYKDFYELIFELRRFYYLYWIAGKTLSQVKQTSFNIIKALKEKKHINYLKAIFSNKLNSEKIYELAISQLTSNMVDKEAWIKPLLILIEYDLTDQSNPILLKLNNDLHLEHILPKKYKMITEWNHITEEIKNRWLHSIANLTLLSGKKNIDASNNPFNIKMTVYQGTHTDNTTSFRLSQKVLDDFNQRIFNQQWNEDALKDRYNWILEQLEKLLAIDLTYVKQIEGPKIGK